MSREEIKKAVGYRAAELVHDGMVVGLGTGSTAFYLIERLIQRCQEGLCIHAVASSDRSFQQALKGKIPLLDINQISRIDLTLDGADEIDTQKRMIKGGGGALVREKIMAAMSREMVVIVDESKLVSSLGKCKLPVEIIPFATRATLHHIEKAGYQGALRQDKDSKLYVTDNGNYIVDIHFEKRRDNPEKDHETLIHIPGVIDTGFFFHLAGRIVVGFSDGQVVIKP